VVICQGGRFGGWTLYLKKGKPVYTYNWGGKERYNIESSQSLPKGNSKLRFEFTYDGNGRGKGGMGKIFIDGKEVAQGKIEHTMANIFSAVETADVGVDLTTPVTEDYKENKFTGKIEGVTVDIGNAKI
jgi:hypothetical protein